MTVVYIVDDNPDDRDWLVDLMSKAGVKQARAFEDVDALISALSDEQPETILLDCWLGHHVSFAYVPKIKSVAPDAKVVMISGQGRHDFSTLAAKFGIGFFSKNHLDEANIGKLVGSA